MDKSSSTKAQQEQVQAIYLAQANIFSYEARKSAKSWVPLCDSAVPISILYDNTRSIYRIISVDADIKEVVVNTTVLPELEFVKTTQKFGYWKDVASGRVFGIGFASEYEAEAFDECLKKVKSNLGPPSVHSSVSLNAGAAASESSVVEEQGKSSSSPYQQPRLPIHQDTPALQGQGDGPCLQQLQQQQHLHHHQHHQALKSAEAGSGKKLNWDDYEQIAPTVLSLLQSSRHHHTLPSSNNPVNDHRPSTYKVDLPIISSSNTTNNSTLVATGSSQTHSSLPLPPPPQTSQAQQAKRHFPNLEELRMHPPPAYHLPPAPYYAQHQHNNHGGSSSIDTSTSGPVMSLPMPMSIPHHHHHHGYCYQGPPSMSSSPVVASSADPSSKTTQAPSATCFDRRAATDLVEEMSRLRAENVKLSQSLIESTCAAKKWEVQVNSLRDDNIQLVKSVADLNTKLESLSKDVRENQEQASRWKDHYQQAVTSAKEKGRHLKDAEDKLKGASADKARIESVMKDLEEELKRQQQINKEQQNANSGHVVAGQYTNKYFKELEEHYRKLLSDSQKRIEEIMRKDADRKNVLRGVDTLFTGAIQGLINIHGQIRQAYEQQ